MDDFKLIGGYVGVLSKNVTILDERIERPILGKISLNVLQQSNWASLSLSGRGKQRGIWKGT